MKPEKIICCREHARIARQLIAIVSILALLALAAVPAPRLGGENTAPQLPGALPDIVSDTTTPYPGAPAQQDIPALPAPATDIPIAAAETPPEAAAETSPPTAIPLPAFAVPARAGRAAAKPLEYTVTTFVTDATGGAQAATPAPADAALSRPDASIVTVAGQNGGAGSANGPGADARFASISNLIADKSGNIYCKSGNLTYLAKFGEDEGYEIRKITPDGVASTIENTVGYPLPWAMDSAGNIYVTKAAKIYKIDGSGETTLYADGAAQWVADPDDTYFIDDTVCDMTFGENGNLFVVTTPEPGRIPTSNILWKVDTGGSITRLRASEDDGLYLSDPRTLWHGGASRMTAANGNLYILGGMTQVALWQPDGIYMIDINTGAATPFASLPDEDTGMSLSTDSSGNFYVSTMTDDSGSQTTRYGMTIFAPSGDMPRAVHLVTDDSEDWDYCLLMNDSNGNIFASNDDIIYKLDDSGVPVPFAGKKMHAGHQDGTGSGALLSHPADITLDSSGNAHVSETYIEDEGPDYKLITRIRKIDPGFNVTTVCTATTADEAWPALATSASDSIICLSGSRIMNISPEGQVSYIDGSYKELVGLAVDMTGQPYTLSYKRLEEDYPWSPLKDIVLQSIAPTGEATTKASIPIGDNDTVIYDTYPCLGLAADSLGNLYITNPYEHTIVKVSAAGDVSSLAGASGTYGYADGTGTAALFQEPVALAVDKRDYLYVSDAGNSLIRRVNTVTGEVTTIIGKPSEAGAVDGGGDTGRVNGVIGITVDIKGDGLIYMCDAAENVVRILQVAPEILEHPVGSTVNAEASVTLSADAMGAPYPDYQWYKGGAALAGQTGATLTLSNVQAADAGDYAVVASNILAGNVFTATSNVATLTVNGSGGETPGGTGGGSRKGGGAPSIWFLAALALAAFARCRTTADNRS